MWEELARTYIGSVRITFIAVDCKKESHLCDLRSIESYPTLRVYSNGKPVSHYRELVKSLPGALLSV